ncbi:hypothetical protein H4582DRAFT_1955452, partial [Lactarius indigo]
TRILSRDSTTKFLLATALFLAPSLVKSGSSKSDLEIRQSLGSAHDTICSGCDVYTGVQRDTSCARRVTRSWVGWPCTFRA